MGVTSVSFLLFVFIAITCYYLFPKSIQWVWLLITSLAFYCLAAKPLTFLYMLVTIVSIYFFALNMNKPDTSPSTRKLYLILGLLINFGMLSVLKYGNFIYQQFNQLLHFSESEGFDFLLPLGISFYIFQSAGYLIDVYRKKVSPESNLFRFMLFVTFFPQIFQGPISRYNQLAPQLYMPHDFNWDGLRKGFLRILWGYFKKMVIADRISIFVSFILINYVENQYTGLIIFLAFFAYGFQIYADFSGGIDIISGIAECFGITLTQNFNQPFFATSVSNFWQRWHMTLGTWMKDYVFYPIALSKPFTSLTKKLRKRISPSIAKVIAPTIASFIVFLLVGLWHGAARKYIYYGIYNAIFVSSASLLAPLYKKIRNTLHVNTNAFSYRVFQMLRTTFFITIGRYISRSPSATEAWALFNLTLSKWNPWILVDGSVYEFGLIRPQFLLVLVALCVLFFVDFKKEQGVDLRTTILKQDIITRYAVYLILLFSILIFGAYGNSIESTHFIYEGF